MGIGKRLKEAREAAGLTQEELGKLVGVTGSAITNYEKETSHPRESVLYALFDVLNVTPNYLFQDSVHTIEKSPDPEGPRDEFERTIMKNVATLTEDQQEILIAVLRVMIEQNQRVLSSAPETDGGQETK